MHFVNVWSRKYGNIYTNSSEVVLLTVNQQEKLFPKKYALNTFVPNAPFLYTLSLRQGVEKECIGNEWVKFLLLDSDYSLTVKKLPS